MDPNCQSPTKFEIVTAALVERSGGTRFMRADGNYDAGELARASPYDVIEQLTVITVQRTQSRNLTRVYQMTD
jgi:hypothetical protein